MNWKKSSVLVGIHNKIGGTLALQPESKNSIALLNGSTKWRLVDNDNHRIDDDKKTE